MPDNLLLRMMNVEEIVDNERVACWWNWVDSDETAEVDVTFQSHPDGTEVQVTHSGVESSTSLDNHSAGWEAILTVLRPT